MLIEDFVDQRALAGPRDTCDADDLVQWHRHVDVFEIVDACAANVDRLNVGHDVALLGRGRL